MSCLAQNVESVYTYDADGNMLSANGLVLTYDSANRLISAGNNSYTYDIENTRVKNLCNGVGLIGEETAGSFKTYHFDYWKF